MTTTSDLVEAHTFRRRRLTTAFVSGASGAWRDAERRAVRTTVGGLALAVLVGAGAVVAHVLAPGPPDDWASPGLVVSADTGQAFVILPEDDGSTEAGDATTAELRPVANLASARLILGADVEPTVVPQATLEEQRVGPDVGIPSAPASLPAPDRLVQTGWTACAADARGVRLQVGAQPAPTVVDGAQVVAVESDFYLVANVQTDADRPTAYALRLPGDAGADNLLSALGLPARVLAPRVPRAWLDLLPAGAPLVWESFGLSGAELRPAGWGAAGVPARARIGDVLVDPSGAAVVLTEHGPADLDPFAAVVYAHTRMPRGGAPAVMPVRALPDLARTVLPAASRHWPTLVPDPIGTDACAVLTTAEDGPAVVQLARAPDPGAEDVGVTVEPGRGAVVRGVRPDGDPVALLIDGAGRAHPLEGDDTLERLGYADVVPPTVPDSWLRLLDEGVPLSRERALCAGERSCG